MKVLLILAAGAVASLVAIAPVRAQEREIVGDVLQVTGTWYIEGKLVKEGPVRAGSIVRAKTPANAPFSTIVIRLRSGTMITRSCSRAGNCGTPIELPSKLDLSASSERVAQAQIRASRNRERYARLLSGRTAGSLMSSVVELTEGGIDFSPVFAHDEARLFVLQIELIPRQDGGGGKAATVLGPVRYQWRPEKPIPLPVPGMDPGLYRIRFFTDEDSPEPTGESIWILASDPARFKMLSCSFAEALSVAKDKDRKLLVEPEAFLRAYLEILAETNPL